MVSNCPALTVDSENAKKLPNLTYSFRVEAIFEKIDL